MKRKDYKKRKKSSGKRLAIKVSLLLTLSLFIVVAAYAASLQKKAENARIVHMKPSLTDQNPKYVK